MSETEARQKLFSVAKEKLSDVAANLLVALLIWLFGTLVFIPAANEILPQRIPLAISLVILIGFTVFVVRAVNNGLNLVFDSAANVIAYDYKNWKKSKIPIENLKKTAKSLVYIIALITFYLLYSPFLLTIHPALNGLMLIPVILWTLWTIMNIINTTVLEKTR
jgi:hypothetical protein